LSSSLMPSTCFTVSRRRQRRPARLIWTWPPSVTVTC
jgi:hypothetical protein